MRFEASGLISDLADGSLDVGELGRLHTVRPSVNLLALIVINLLDESLEGSLVSQNHLEMLEEDFLLGIEVAQEGQRLPVLLFHMRLDVHHEHVGRMILALINLLDLSVLQAQLTLLLTQFFVILVCFGIIVVEFE